MLISVASVVRVLNLLYRTATFCSFSPAVQSYGNLATIILKIKKNPETESLLDL